MKYGSESYYTPGIVSGNSNYSTVVVVGVWSPMRPSPCRRFFVFAQPKPTWITKTQEARLMADTTVLVVGEGGARSDSV